MICACYSIQSLKQVISEQDCFCIVNVKSSYIWLLRDVFINFSGTTKTNNLDANVESLKVKLTAEDLKEIASQIRAEDVAGGRQYSSYAHTSWKYADTPKK